MALAPTRTRAPATELGRCAGLEDRAGGEEPLGPRTAVVEQEAAAALGRQHRIADAQRGDLAPAEAGAFAARPRALDQVARGALRHAQKLRHEAGIELVSDPHQKRHAPDDGIAIDGGVDGSVPCCRSFDRRQARDRAGIGGGGRARIVPRQRESGLQDRELAAWALGGGERGDRGESRQRLSQGRVRIREPRHRLARGLPVRAIGPGCGQRRGCGAVGLGKDDVEGDGGGAHLVQPDHQLGQARPRPRPLPESLQALVVDIDDAHRRRQERPGLQPLIGIEDGRAGVGEEPRFGRLEGGEGQQQQPRQEEIGPAAQHLGAGSIARCGL